MTRVTGLASSLELTRVIFLCYFLIDFKKKIHTSTLSCLRIEFHNLF